MTSSGKNLPLKKEALKVLNKLFELVKTEDNSLSKQQQRSINSVGNNSSIENDIKEIKETLKTVLNSKSKT